MTNIDLQSLVGETLVLDLSSPFVCIGTLAKVLTDFVVLTEADMHDLRDTSLSRGQYVDKSRQFGPTVNRRRIWVNLREIVAVSRLADVSLE